MFLKEYQEGERHEKEMDGLSSKKLMEIVKGERALYQLYQISPIVRKVANLLNGDLQTPEQARAAQTILANRNYRPERTIETRS